MPSFSVLLVFLVLFVILLFVIFVFFVVFAIKLFRFSYPLHLQSLEPRQI